MWRLSPSSAPWRDDADARSIALPAASRARVLHNYRYEVDMEVVMGGAGRVALQRVAVCDHAWQREEMRERYGVPRCRL